jgi:hypothetical protein
VGISCSIYSSVPPSIFSRWSRSPARQHILCYVPHIVCYVHHIMLRLPCIILCYDYAHHVQYYVTSIIDYVMPAEEEDTKILQVLQYDILDYVNHIQYYVTSIIDYFMPAEDTHILQVLTSVPRTSVLF